MFEAQALDFPFVATLPKTEKTRVVKLWDHFRELKHIVAEKGMIIPQHLAAELLGVSKQRVNELVDAGRFEVVMVGGVRYVTEDSVVRFAKEERKAGRPFKVPRTAREMWKASRAAAPGTFKDASK